MKFDVLKDFNVFAHNELIMRNADCEGVMAVSRNLVLENYSVGVGFSPFECQKEINSLVVGGKVKIKNSVNYNGNTCLQKNKFSNYYNMSNPSGRVIYRKLVDFESCFSNCVSIQNSLKNQRANTVVESDDFGTLCFKSLYKDEALHFFVNSKVLSNANVVNFDIETDKRSLIFINVIGERVDFSNITMLKNNKKLNCENSKNMVWNFIDTVEIIINNTDFYGTIFSTSADLKCVNSQIFGNVYCYNIYGNSDFYLCKLSKEIVRYLNTVDTRIINFNSILDKETKENIEQKVDLELLENKIESLQKNNKSDDTTHNTEIKTELKSQKKLHNLKAMEDYVTEVKEVKCDDLDYTYFQQAVDIYINNLNKVEHSIGLLLTAEASKYERALELATCVDDHFKINHSLIKTLKNIKTMQILINESLDILDSLKITSKQNKSCKRWIYAKVKLYRWL